GQDTVGVKFSTSSTPMPFEAVKVIGYAPMAAVVPESVPPLYVTPVGSAPLSLTAGAGKPVAVTVKVAATLGVNVNEFALVMSGVSLIVSVKFCTALGVIPLLAVICNKYTLPAFGSG